MTLATHRCAADGCQSQISKSLLMCLNHWRMVPNQLQRLLIGFRRRGFRQTSIFERGVTLKLYCELLDKAVAAVREKEIKRQARNNAAGDVLDFN